MVTLPVLMSIVGLKPPSKQKRNLWRSNIFKNTDGQSKAKKMLSRCREKIMKKMKRDCRILSKLSPMDHVLCIIRGA